MKFVKTEDLKIGMRLARPIYSKSGVLLFDSNSNLTLQAIESVKNFGLLGIYILEPAEPALQMSEEDREFERFQTMTVFAIQEEFEKILTTGKQQKMHVIAESILKTFGRQNDRVNFYQNLRSKDDYVHRHCLNVAILSAMITRGLNMRREEQHQVIYAAIIHDIGKMSLGGELVYGKELTVEQRMRVFNVLMDTGEVMEKAFGNDGLIVKRICNQAVMRQMDSLKPADEQHNIKMVRGANILLVANRYDELTGMTLEGTANSEVKALKELQSNPELYEPEIVEALINSVKILSPGVSVELNTGEKALVLTENSDDVFRPTVLTFRNNQIIDLSLRINEDFEIEDIMKTLDNRCIIDKDALHKAGF